MKFTKLKISGFKSFVDPTFLEIKSGLTGIVGPNGCGKSNIVEAIKWNMGESGPSNLRAGEMEDVIFSGTKTRAPRNFAEVTISVESDSINSTNKLFDSDEINISRKIIKNEGSTYSVNGKELRQRDVQIMFADQSIGSRSNAIVNQGQIGKIINSKPIDRRKILEEAAGISGVHARRHETELKLRATEVNLEKLNDILDSEKLRLKELFKQSSQAKNYKRISDKIRELEAKILYQKWNIAQNNLKNNEEELKNCSIQVTKLTKSTEAFYNNKLKIEKLLPNLRSKEQEIINKHNKLEIEEKLLDSESEKILENKNTIKENINNLEIEIKKENEIKIKTLNQINELQNILKNIPDDDTQNNKLEKITKSLEITKKEEENINRLLNDAKRKKSENLSTRENMHLLKIKANSNLNNMREKNQTYSSELSKKDNITKLKKNIVEANKNIHEFVNNLDNYEQKESLEYKNIDFNLKSINFLKSKQLNKENHLHDQQRNLDKAITSKNILNGLILNNNNNSIINLLSYPDDLEKAVEACLGHGLKATLDEGPIQWRKIKIDNIFPFPKKIIKLSNYFKGIEEIKNILDSTGIVSSREEGDILQTNLKPGQQLVTKEGDLWRWDGYKHTSEAQTPAEQMLKHKRELKEIGQKITKLEGDIRNISLHVENIKENIKLLQDQNIKKEKNLSNIRVEKKNIAQRIELEKQVISNYTIEENIINTELSMVKSSISENEITINLINNEIKQIETEEKQLIEQKFLNNEVLKLEKIHKTKSSELSQILSVYHQTLNEVNNKKTRYSSLNQELKRYEEQVINISERLAYLETSKEKNYRSLLNLKELPTMIKNKKANILKQINDINTKKQAVLKELHTHENLYKKVSNHYINENETLTESREKRARQEGLYEQSQLQIINNKERIKEKLNLEPEDLIKIFKFTVDQLPDIEDSEYNLEKLILKRERVGPVNLVAEKDASELEIKLEEIEIERDELITAINKLRGSIGSINKESRNRLLNAFDLVNSHFKEKFTQLFGGGEAYLKLEGSDDPLEAGLELMASPPGKKLQQLDLLTGGEKAITALALIFSVFLTKPSPVCILDEVDAPLDDSNVDRFCNLIDEITKKAKTRFLIVTHHRLTMARMDRLYGVTMNEPGVSQLVSVSLRDAEYIKAAE